MRWDVYIAEKAQKENQRISENIARLIDTTYIYLAQKNILIGFTSISMEAFARECYPKAVQKQ